MTTLDDVAAQLREWRIAAGSPSFAELVRRVGELRAAGGADPRHAAPGRVTVYDCFRDGRSRIDVDLAADLAAALGIEGDEHAAWRRRCAEAMRPPVTHGLVTTSDVAPVPVEPWVETSADEFEGSRALFAGIGGSGKSQAAARLLSRLRARGAIDGVLTVRIDGADADPLDVLHAAGHELAVRLPDDPREAATRLFEVLDRRRMALLLDDVTDVDQLTALAAASSAVPLVATSRRALEVPGLPRVDLPEWSRTTVIDHLTRMVGAERTEREPEATAALADLTAGLPLVVALVTARVRGTPTWSLADHVAALRERRTGDRIEDAVKTSMDATHSALSPDARDLLALLASGPRSGLSDRTLRSVSGPGLDPALAELESAYLLGRDDRRHQLHDIARGHARGRSVDDEPPSARTRRTDRLIDQLCAEAWAVARVLAPSDLEACRFDPTTVDVEDPQGWLGTDLPGALELVREARERRPWAAVELSEAVATSLERTGLSGVSGQLHAAAREAAVSLDDAVGEARARCALAVTAMRHDHPDVPLDEITALATRAEDSWTLARLGNLRGILAMRAGADAEGTRLFRNAHQLALEAGHRALAPAIAGNLALALAYAGDLDGALRWNTDTLAGARETGNRGLAATTLSNLSEVQRMLDRADDAVVSAEQAVGFAEATGDQLALTHACANLGASLTCCGRPTEAIGWLERAERTAADIGLVEVEATVHTRIGEALLAIGDGGAAEARFRAALESHNDSPIDPATALHHLGRMVAERDPAEARHLLDRALEHLGDGFEQVAAAIRADRAALGAAQ